MVLVLEYPLTAVRFWIASLKETLDPLLQHKFRLPTDEQTTLRQVLLIQARAMARVMRGKQAHYVGFVG